MDARVWCEGLNTCWSFIYVCFQGSYTPSAVIDCIEFLSWAFAAASARCLLWRMHHGTQTMKQPQPAQTCWQSCLDRWIGKGWKWIEHSWDMLGLIGLDPDSISSWWFSSHMREWYGTFLPPGYAVQATAGTNDGGNDGVDQNWPWKLVLELVDIWACTNWTLVLR